MSSAHTVLVMKLREQAPPGLIPDEFYKRFTFDDTLMELINQITISNHRIRDHKDHEHTTCDVCLALLR